MKQNSASKSNPTSKSNDLLNQSGPGLSKEAENVIVKKIEESKPQPTVSENGTGRRVILLRNAERMDRIFPEWVDMAFNEQGKYRPYDLNQPLQIPFRSGDYLDYRYDSPITELVKFVNVATKRLRNVINDASMLLKQLWILKVKMVTSCSLCTV
ncbi:Ubiquitin-associated and SH3 domain-containing protein [Trichinella pseudospiralis]